ncbi:amidoligase enzyme domain-containing protein [Purpureocillium lavendulum]|uniref:Amidoligase enzyme domain-containing protein n=1 Tax=Purpureocillium lavendulum TaxID=1247861 RepID=A0AB34FIR8_9HYPO|nr:amidoligase enzyme domain-containing protein [Purpureocillium lavendulum]
MSPSQIGIELEFMVAFPDHQPGAKRAKPKDDRWPDGANTMVSENDIYGNKACQKAVCAALAGIGLPAARMGDTDAVSGDPDHVDKPDCVIAFEGKRQLLIWNPVAGGSGGKEERFNNWFVTHEASIVNAIDERRMDVPAGYRWYSTEIASPILSDQQEFQDGLPTMKRALASIQNNVKLWLNSECGLHVHVSPLEVALDIVVARRLAALVFLLERPLLLQLCHPGRSKAAHARLISSDSCIAKYSVCAPGSTADDLHEVVRLRRLRDESKGRCQDEPRTFQIICAILSEPDCTSLTERLRAPQGGGADGGKCMLAMSKFGTVEFRYPEASFDVDFVSSWVDVVRRLLAIAALPDADYATKLCEIYELATRNTRMGWINYIAALGLNERADVFKKRVCSYEGDLKDLDKPTILPRVG